MSTPVIVLATVLAVVFLVSGLGHVALPTYVDALLPRWVPARRAVRLATGAADLVAGVLLVLPATRATGGAVAVVLLAAYMVSHLDAVGRRDADGPLLLRPWLVAVRVLVNVGYLAAAAVVALAGR